MASALQFENTKPYDPGAVEQSAHLIELHNQRGTAVARPVSPDVDFLVTVSGGNDHRGQCWCAFDLSLVHRPAKSLWALMKFPKN
jgi:hypothetical protein